MIGELETCAQHDSHVLLWACYVALHDERGRPRRVATFAYAPAVCFSERASAWRESVARANERS